MKESLSKPKPNAKCLQNQTCQRNGATGGKVWGRTKSLFWERLISNAKFNANLNGRY